MRVRVLGAERRAERVDLAQRQAVRLDVELAGDGEERLACRRSPCGNRSRPCRRAAGWRGRASTRGTSGPAPSASEVVMIGVLTQKKPFSVEVAVDRLAMRVAHARDRAEQVGARAQVRDLAQELQRVLLGLDRIGFRIVDPADDFDRARPAARTPGPCLARAPASPSAITRAAGGQVLRSRRRSWQARPARRPGSDRSTSRR